MLKRVLCTTNIILWTALSTIACAQSNNSSNTQNPWQQAIQLQEQKTSNDVPVQNPPTTNLAALTQHTIAVRNPIVHQGQAQTVAKPAISKNVSSNKSKQIAPNKNKPPVPAHIWNLQGVDVSKVIAEVSQETGKNFIVDPTVTGKVTIVSSKPLNADEIYQVFLSTLQVLGYAAIPAGNAIKIVPLRDGGREASALSSDDVAPANSSIVVQVLPLHYVSAIQLVPILNPLIPTWASVSAVMSSNTLIISGTASVVKQVSRIVKRVDTPEANGVDVVPLQYATAENVADELNKLIQSSRAYGDTVNAAVSPDDRSNSIMLTGNESARLRLKVLISQIDQNGTNGMGDTQVIRLHYIQVQDILPIVRSVAHQNPGSATATSSMSMNSGGYSGGSSNGSSSGSISGVNSNFTNQVQSITNSQLNSGAISGDGSKQQVIITGDVTNNALIITAPAAMMRQLQNVIARLDARPDQVLVQGIIAEVDADKADKLGIQWGTGEGDTGLGPTNPFQATGGMGFGFIKNGSLRALVQALSSDSSSNILSTPSISVLNNGHADIEVGKTFSEQSGQYDPTAGGGGVQTQYQDKNVGLTLQVTPQITGDDSIRLAIDQTNSSVLNDPGEEIQNANNPNPTTSQEKISTSVLVNNGQILVLGGLINSEEQKVVSQVPILGDIPLLGLLFRHTETQNVKKDLLVFLRPIVISNSSQIDQLTSERYNFLRERQILSSHGLTDFAASSTLMSPNDIKLPIPFTTPSG